MTRIARFVLLAALTALAACGGGHSQRSQQEITLRNYEGAIRWGEFEEAYGYIDPAVREQNPLTDLEQERFKQVEVTSYDVRRVGTREDGSIDQLVHIGLISKATQVERTIVDHQHWVFDPVAKRWWLETGLPDLNPAAH